MTIILCLVNIPVLNIHAYESDSSTEIVYEQYSEDRGISYNDVVFTSSNDNIYGNSLMEPSTIDPEGVIKVVLFVIEIIKAGITIYNAYRYLNSIEPDWNAVVIWADDNGYSMDDINASITNVIYDNGCYSSYFPSNPFCKIATE